MQEHQTTIIDIARRLNLSTSTVSRALTNHPDVKAVTRKAVQALAKELDYQPNQVALSLLRCKTHSVGVVIPDIERPFFASAVSGIQQVASEAGYRVMICQSKESQKTEADTLAALVASRVDGLLICHSRETNCYDAIHALHRKRIPLVFFDRVCEEVPASKVLLDNHDGAFMAVEHLISVGCRRIAVIAGPRHLVISQERLEGYLHALGKYDLPLDEDLVLYCDFQNEKVIEGTQRLLALPQPPDGIFSVYDTGAIVAMSVLKERGLLIPGEVAVAGFGNEPMSAYIEPALTTISQNPYQMGQLAAQLFLNQINAVEPPRPEVRLMKAELLVRRSSLAF